MRNIMIAAFMATLIAISLFIYSQRAAFLSAPTENARVCTSCDNHHKAITKTRKLLKESGFLKKKLVSE